MIASSVVGGLPAIQHSFFLTFTIGELFILLFAVFELGYLLGCRIRESRCFETSQLSRAIPALPPSQHSLPADELNQVQQTEPVRPQLALAYFEKNEHPYVAPTDLKEFVLKHGLQLNCDPLKRDASMRILFEKVGDRILKSETYEVVSEFEDGPSVKASLCNLSQILKGVSTQLSQGQRLNVVVKDAGDKKECLVTVEKRHQHEIMDAVPRPISITGVLENGKFRSQFVNISQIGRGAYGSVFRATKSIENKVYAIKRIYFADTNQDFLREVRSIIHISHPNIVRYYNWWVEQPTQDEMFLSEDAELSSSGAIPQKSSKELISIPMSDQSSHGIEFVRADLQNKQKDKSEKRIEKKSVLKRKILVLHIQMQLCEGGNLADLLKKSTGPRDPAMAFQLFRQIFQGVQMLHQNGIVHRDLKPGNIFIDEKKQRLKIGDFGLATISSQEQGARAELLKRLGTPSYMAPELRQSNSKIDRLELLDVYSLGVIYFELLKAFGTDHERLASLKLISEGRIDLPATHERERRLIRSMTCSVRNRLTLAQLRTSKPFLELAGLNSEL